MKLLLIFVLALPNLALAKINLGMVDIQKVLLTVDEGKSVRTKLEDFFKSKQDMLKKDEEKFKDLQQKLEKQKNVLNESAKVNKEKELRELYVSIQEKTMGYQRELQDMENNMKKPLIDKIKGIVENVSKKAGVELTFEVGASAVVYAESEKDITEEVISSYNQKYPVKK